MKIPDLGPYGTSWEHRQNSDKLLIACLDFLIECRKHPNTLDTTVFYDDAARSGHDLMNDIAKEFALPWMPSGDLPTWASVING
jgi:hypothetical protein